MLEAYLLFTIILITLGLFAWGYWRYDVVALSALIACAFVGAVPFKAAFTGFSNPAVITVACVMVITKAITRSGIVDYAVKHLTPVTGNVTLQVFVLCLITAILSAFMNNVGALALMMPIAIQSTLKYKRSPSLILMPLAISSILGGLTTEIGTPPNILISAFRQQAIGHSFAFFDYSPVGVTLAVIGILFVTVIGWRLIPQSRKGSKQVEEMFKIQDYITEIKITKESPSVGKTIRELERSSDGDIEVIALIRNKRKRFKNLAKEPLEADDILIVEATHNDLQKLLRAGKLELVGGKKISSDVLRSDDIDLMEAVVPPGSRIESRSSSSMRLRTRYRINLLAIAREGDSLKQQRLHRVNLRAGDVVLLQGDAESLQETTVSLGFLPLVERGVQVGLKTKAVWPLAIFAIAIVSVVLHILPIQIAFAAAVLAMIIFNIMPPRLLYESIDWPIIILLGAMIPVGSALQSTGGTVLITHAFLGLAGYYSPIIILALLLIITMTLSDFMNNAATTVLMAPIALSLAKALQVSIDPFLMAVAVGASSCFLTPIGHQNNVLVMGPGGYKFFDYIRIGLPLELIILVVAVPMILWIWPLH